MTKIKKFIVPLIVFLMLITPAFSFSANEGTGLVPCDNVAKVCDFTQFMNLINTVIKFTFEKLVVPIAAIMFAYAGFLLVTAGEEVASARTKAKNIFMNALIGLVLAAAAWLIIRTILSILGYDGAWIFDRF